MESTAAAASYLSMATRAELLQVNVEAHERDLGATNNPTFGAAFSLLLEAPDATQS
ncbi:hypothetical protein [Tunturiibacter gelidoferens]|uniref:Uncharacterized protein n=1 Tax=Tunturiibacter lichenicola TaxID=2051959 RepID=A0A7Y9NRR9_9BACT|nr:hypothetical protein [Edaphobacter lichenicola]NYF54137.1 hypothetical protein [Edaphobacter lichenicola]